MDLLRQLPIELQLEVLKNLTPEDILNILYTKGETFSSLFALFTNTNDGSHITHKLVRTTRIRPKRLATEDLNQSFYGHINIIELKQWRREDLERVYNSFKHTFNILVLDYKNVVLTDQSTIRNFFESPICKVLKMNSNKICSQVDCPKYPRNLVFKDCRYVSISPIGNNCQRGAVEWYLSNVEIFTYESGDVERLFQCTDFSKCPTHLLRVYGRQNGESHIEDKVLAAESILIDSPISSISGLELPKCTKMSLVRLGDNVKIQNIDAPSIIELHFEFLLSERSTVMMTNIHSPVLKEFSIKPYTPVGVDGRTLVKDASSPDSDFSFLRSVSTLTVDSLNDALCKCPSFDHLTTLNLSIVNTFPKDRLIHLPAIKNLNISIKSNCVASIPEFDAQSACTYILETPRDAPQSMVENLPKVLGLMGSLTKLDILRVCAPLSDDVLRKMARYFKRKGHNTLRTFKGAPLELFQPYNEFNLVLPELEELHIGSYISDLQAVPGPLEICLTAGSLKTLTIFGFLFESSVKITDLPSLSSLFFSNTVKHLILENVEMLKSLEINDELEKITTGRLPKLRYFSYCKPEGMTASMIEKDMKCTNRTLSCDGWKDDNRHQYSISRAHTQASWVII